jgi:hypothetical protein
MGYISTHVMFSLYFFKLSSVFVILGGLVVGMLIMGPKVAGSNLTKDDGFLWMIKICSMHFLWRGSKFVSPML